MNDAEKMIQAKEKNDQVYHILRNIQKPVDTRFVVEAQRACKALNIAINNLYKALQ